MLSYVIADEYAISESPLETLPRPIFVWEAIKCPNASYVLLLLSRFGSSPHIMLFSNISVTMGAMPENLYRFEFNHVALWMSVVRLEIGFLQDFIEKPFLSMETSHSSRGPHEIRHFICEGTRSADQILEALHSLIEGNDGHTFRKGKEVAKIIRAAYIAGLLSQSPVPYATMKMEFPNIGAESGYYKYFDKARMKDAEFQPLIDKLKDFAKER